MSDSVQLIELKDFLETIDLDKIQEQLGASSYQKILDYIELEKKRQSIGEKGEQFIYEREVTRLKKVGSKYADIVSREPAGDPKNGYDIDSFTETGEKIYIEVKSTTGSADEPFYMTFNEREKAKQVVENGGIYQVHRVYNVGKESIDAVIYEDLKQFRFEDILYRVELM